MAIQKSKTLPNGAVGDYWRITSINIDRQNLKITGTIALFKDAAASTSGSPPLGASKVLRFPLVMSEFLAAPNAVAFIYGKILARAATEITHDIQGNLLETPLLTDPDLVGGINVF